MITIIKVIAGIPITIKPNNEQMEQGCWRCGGDLSKKAVKVASFIASNNKDPRMKWEWFCPDCLETIQAWMGM